MSDSSLDTNASFCGSGRSVEFLDQINQASIVILAGAGIVPRDAARNSSRKLSAAVATA